MRISPSITRLTGGCLLGLGAAAAQAGGFQIQDQSTRAMGMADAFVASADDASAVYYNPAGLTQLAAPQVIGNAYFAHANVHYSGDGRAQGYSENSDGRYYTVPNFYAATPFKPIPGMALGLGVYSPFGLGSRWHDDGYVSNWSTLGEIGLYNINPTVAYQVTDRLSLAVGADYYTSRAINRRIDRVGMPALGVPPMGEVDLDVDGDGWGWNTGAQYKLTDTVNLGLTFRSPVVVDYDGTVKVEGWDKSYDASTNMNYPGVCGAGVSWQATKNWRWELAAEYTLWSTMDEQAIATSSPLGTITTPMQWNNSWVCMLGTEYQLTEKWTLRGGYAYNEMPAPEEYANANTPTGDMHVLAAGVGYQLTKALRLDTAVLVGYAMKRTLDNPYAPTGTYDSYTYGFSIGATYSF